MTCLQEAQEAWHGFLCNLRQKGDRLSWLKFMGASKIVVRATVWQVMGHLITLITATGVNSYSSQKEFRGDFISP